MEHLDVNIYVKRIDENIQTLFVAFHDLQLCFLQVKIQTAKEGFAL